MIAISRRLLAALALAPASRLLAGARAVRVAAASDLRFALDPLLERLRKRRPDVAPSVSFGSSGSFFVAIQNGAPFDVFLSADVEYAERLGAAGLAADGGVFRYAVGRLAVWVPRASTLPIEREGVRALAAPGVRHVAIANPRHAPYGRAAEAALRAAGVLEAVSPKLVLGESVSQAAQMAESGAADAGIVSLSLVLAPALRAAGRHAVVPEPLHPPIVQGGVILKGAADPEAARVFRDALLGPDGRDVLAAWGFGLPPLP